jgi:dihydropteroate synthase
LEKVTSVVRTYIRPIAPLPPGTTRSAAPEALFVGGTVTGFAAVEIATRAGGHITRRIVTPSAARAEAPDLVAAVEAPRAHLAGLSLDRPRIMGIVNVTPDSFSDGGRFFDTGVAVAHALALEAEGADILDIGGESTRPGSDPLDPEDECRRVLPVISALARQSKARLSIDTRNALVMRRALDAGAHIVNDVSALQHDAESLRVVAEAGVPVILMHMQGTPKTMQLNPTYDDVALDVTDFLADRVAACTAAGIPRERVVVDPGIGFGKTLQHNLALMQALASLHALGTPVLLGASRKGFIVKLMAEIGLPPPSDRTPGSVAAALLGAQQGAQILRVHDVAATRQALAVQGYQ